MESVNVRQKRLSVYVIAKKPKAILVDFFFRGVTASFCRPKRCENATTAECVKQDHESCVCAQGSLGVTNVLRSP